MTNPKLDTFRQMVARQPDNALARFGLANEALKAGRLAEALVQLGRGDEATAALRRGIEASRRFGHPSMAAEFEARIEELADQG